MGKKEVIERARRQRPRIVLASGLTRAEEIYYGDIERLLKEEAKRRLRTWNEDGEEEAPA